jgi:hypothetical protein
VWQVRSSTKSMLVSSMWRGLFTVNLFLLTLRTTLDFYCDISRCLWKNVRRKRLELWCNHNWLLHHDNAPAHTSLKTTQYATNNSYCSPSSLLAGLSILWCRFVSQIKNETEGTTFETASVIQRELQAVLDSIKENDFNCAFKRWKKRWDHCIHSQGDYFEGDGNQN